MSNISSRLLLDSHFVPIRLSILCSMLLTLSSCVHFERPSSETNIVPPSQFAEAGERNNGDLAQGWIASFNDPDLPALVDEAIAHNHDLGAAAARLRIAEEGRIGARANLLPSLGYGSSASASRDSDSTTSENYRVSLNASWEIDLWGRLRNLNSAAEADLTAAHADYRAARLSLAANTASAWFNLITAIQQEAISEKNRDSFVRNQNITERNYKAGDLSASPLSVQLGRSNIASAERSLVRARLNRKEAARSLELLLGHYPAAEIEARSTLPKLPKAIPTGVPSELLLRRPDLVAAAANLEASVDRAEAARKDLLPSLNLSSGLSSANGALSSVLLDPEEFVLSVAASVAGRIYNGGAPSADVRQALARNELAIRNFADTALNAFREVETALATEASLAEQQEFLATELKQSSLAESQASRDYSQGLVNILSVLEAQRRAVNARTAMISLRNQRLQNRIDLHRALGGDF